MSAGRRATASMGSAREASDRAPRGGPCGHPCAPKSRVRQSTRPRPTRPRRGVPVDRYARAHLTDPSLLCQAEQHPAQDRGATAELLADLAEIDHRKLYLQAAQPSMHAFCVQVWRLSEDAASKRIHAARAARRFPAIFAALAEGRLHLSAVVLLAPHLTEATVDDLLAAATH